MRQPSDHRESSAVRLRLAATQEREHTVSVDSEVFCERVVAAMLVEVARLLASNTQQATHWVASETEDGFAFAELVPAETEVHDIIAGLVDGGAHGAAFCTFAPLAPEQLVISALVAEPPNASLRR
jgi:hypothetical protein